MKKLAFVLLALVVLAGCESGTNEAQTKAPEKKERPPEYATGRVALQRMVPGARMWAADAQPYKLTSEPTTEATGKDGTAAVWRGGFASASRRNLKLFTWVGTGPDRGTSSGVEDSYNPNNASTRTFDLMYLKADTDKAFSVAQQHGGEKLLKAKPDMPVVYQLDWNPRENQLVWHVMYGGTGLDMKLRVAVDASTGLFLRIER